MSCDLEYGSSGLEHSKSFSSHMFVVTAPDWAFVPGLGSGLDLLHNLQ